MNEFGLTQKQRTLLKNLLAKNTLPGQSVWVFGSRSRGDHRKNSDLDLLLDGDSKWSDVQIEQLKDSLEESDFPYKVDLVRIEEVYPGYKNAILNEKKKLFGDSSQDN